MVPSGPGWSSQARRQAPTSASAPAPGAFPCAAAGAGCPASAKAPARNPWRSVLIAMRPVSASGQFLVEVRIARPLDRDLRRSLFEREHVVWCQLDIRGAEILDQPLRLGRAWNRHDPRLL